MITCKRCGRPAPVGMASCQYCGMPLTDAASNGPDITSSKAPQVAASDQHQPELPAWLETLRTSERPTASTPGAPGFSTSDLVEEGMLPSWMRPEHVDAADNTPSGAYPARRPASVPAPNTDGGFIPTRGMSASSLIDEQSLPAWLQEKQAASQQAPQESISAASLVQPEVLPDWMKKIQPRPSASAAPKPIQYTQSVIPPEGIKGNDLVDQQGLPPWLSNQDTPLSATGQEGLPASSLLDVNALPSWLREANHETDRKGPINRAPGVEWQEEKRDSASAFPPPGQPGQPLASQVPYHQTSTEQAPNMNSNLSAASFIDMNALPDWLRPTEDQRQNATSLPQQPGPGVANSPGQATFGVPPRPDNMRVPSRPRGEMGPREESEVAANVFASMLGVASAAPYFQGQQSRDASGHSQVPPQPQQHLPQPQVGNGTGMPATFGANNMQPGPAGMPSNQGYAQAPDSGGYQGPIHWAPTAGNMPGGMPPQQSIPANGAGMQPGPSMYNSQVVGAPLALPASQAGSPAWDTLPGGQVIGNPLSGRQVTQPNTKPAKRGFLSTILEWFPFSR